VKIRRVSAQERGVRFLPDEEDIASRMDAADIETVVEIFDTPLTGAYNWDYQQGRTRINKLYELGKQLNWNASVDLDWSVPFSRDEFPMDEAFNPFVGYDEYEAMTHAERVNFSWHRLGSQLSQFLHGEQGALLVASQLASCAPSYDAKLYAASQTFDEARHVEVFSRYLHHRVGIMYPMSPNLKLLIDKVLTDPRWDLKFIGMQIIIEGLALAAFNTARMTARDPLLKQLIHYVIRDEARHVTFGVNYLEEYCKTLSAEEIEDRAQFAYEACVVMRDRLAATDIYQHFGWDVERARERLLMSLTGHSESRATFAQLLFGRVVPNLKRIGLLTDRVRPLYQQLGVLEFETLPHDGVTSWEELERPLTAGIH
jgi:hypothetical protein